MKNDFHLISIFWHLNQFLNINTSNRFRTMLFYHCIVKKSLPTRGRKALKKPKTISELISKMKKMWKITYYLSKEQLNWYRFTPPLLGPPWYIYLQNIYFRLWSARLKADSAILLKLPGFLLPQPYTGLPKCGSRGKLVVRTYQSLSVICPEPDKGPVNLVVSSNR